MPWLYSGPDDSLCQLRGVGDEGDEDAGAPDASEATAGPANPDAPPRKFWDGSRDRWISAVSARVHPDAVIAAPAPVDADALCLARVLPRCGCPRPLGPTQQSSAASVSFASSAAACDRRYRGMQVTGQLGVVPRHEVQLPQEDVDTETEAACRASQEALELEQALAGEKDFNPWAWTRHRLVCAKGYKPWFGQLFTKDQQEMRYRDIHSDLRAVKESMEKAAKEKTKVAKAAGEGPGSKLEHDRGGQDKERSQVSARPLYTQMDPMRRAHLLGVSIQAHVTSPWKRQDDDEPSRAAAAAAKPAQPHAAADGGGANAKASGAQANGSESGGAASAGGGAGGGAGKKRKPAAPAPAAPATKAKASGGSKATHRNTRDQLWVRFQELYAATETSEVGLRIRYEEACRLGTIQGLLQRKGHVAAPTAAEGAAPRGSCSGDRAALPTLAEKLKARAGASAGDVRTSGARLSAHQPPPAGAPAGGCADKWGPSSREEAGAPAPAMPAVAPACTGSVPGLGEGAQAKGGGTAENGGVRGRDAGAEEESQSKSGEGRRDRSTVHVALNASFALSDDALLISRGKAAGAGNGDAGAEMETTL